MHRTIEYNNKLAKPTNNSQLTTHNTQLTTHNSQLTTRNSQLTTHNSQLATFKTNIYTYTQACLKAFQKVTTLLHEEIKKFLSDTTSVDTNNVDEFITQFSALMVRKRKIIVKNLKYIKYIKYIKEYLKKLFYLHLF